MTSIAIGCAITTARLDKKMAFNHTTKEDIRSIFPLFKSLAPSFCKTASVGYSYHFFFAYDSVDLFFKNSSNKDIFVETVKEFFEEECSARHIVVSDVNTVVCLHSGKPAWAQSDAMMAAYLHNHHYYHRLNDDSKLQTANWTQAYIKILQAYKPANVGVTGPNHRKGNTGILTFDFVHRNHFDIFGIYYPRAFKGKY